MNLLENTQLYRTYGAHPAGQGWTFRVYAPNARDAALAGDFNGWQPAPMQRQGGDWVLAVPDAQPGQCYKYVITGADGQVRWRQTPMAPMPSCGLTPPAACTMCPASAGTTTCGGSAGGKHR